MTNRLDVGSGQQPAQSWSEDSPDQARPARLEVNTKVCEFLGTWLRSLSGMNVSGAIVTGPEPFIAQPKQRVAGAAPDNLLPTAIVVADSITSSDILAREVRLTAPSHEPWAAGLTRQGYEAAVHVCIPAVAARHFHVLLLTTARWQDESQIRDLAWTALNAWPSIQNAMASQAMLSARELECLQYVAGGYTRDETARVLQCSERNVRHHLTNAMKKLSAPNCVGAVQRAQLMGVRL